MTWQTSLCHGVAQELKRHSIQVWLLHLDRLDVRRIEAAKDGTSLHQGESTCLSLALWSREGPLGLSIPITPDRIHDIPERVATLVRRLSSDTVKGCPMQSVPKWHEGVWNDWQGDWNSTADRWRPEVIRSISDKRIATQQLTLYVERRDLLLRDKDARTRQVIRHATRVVITCRGGSKGRGTWTMTVPFDSPVPRELGPHIKRATRHARLRACDTSTAAAFGSIVLQPTALAQILATVASSGGSNGRGIAEFVPAGISRPTPAFMDDLGFQSGTHAFEANKGLMRFAHDSALPAPCHEQLWIPTGKGRSRATSNGLTVWHFDELLSSSLEKRFALIASGVVATSSGVRDVSKLRLDIPWQAVQEALLDPVRRGQSLLAIRFGETDYYVPALSLGECSWEAL